jgi:hypothetical protein
MKKIIQKFIDNKSQNNRRIRIGGDKKMGGIIIHFGYVDRAEILKVAGGLS